MEFKNVRKLFGPKWSFIKSAPGGDGKDRATAEETGPQGCSGRGGTGVHPSINIFITCNILSITIILL
jgi:hypothetical protein